MRRKLAVLVAAAVVVVGLELFLGPADERARHGASLEKFTIDSHAVGQDLDTQVVVPAGGDSGHRRPLLVFLHGRGGDQLPRPSNEFFDALRDQGKRAPIVASPSGGDHSYWHDRAGGDWGSYVVH
jgi:poly(3-hydroxybutyrate) depolymerase